MKNKLYRFLHILAFIIMITELLMGFVYFLLHNIGYLFLELEFRDKLATILLTIGYVFFVVFIILIIYLVKNNPEK